MQRKESLVVLPQCLGGCLWDDSLLLPCHRLYGLGSPPPET